MNEEIRPIHKFNNNASQSIALFTGVAENVDETTDDVKNAALDISYDFKLYRKFDDEGVSLRSFCTNNNAAYVAVVANPNKVLISVVLLPYKTSDV